jgi:hypothetical protein
MPVGTKSLTVRLDDDLWRQLRYLSIDKGQSLQKMVDRLLREFVAKSGPISPWKFAVSALERSLSRQKRQKKVKRRRSQ